MLKINGTKIKVEPKVKVEIGDIDGESARNARGDIVRDRIAVKRTISLSFPALSYSQIT